MVKSYYSKCLGLVSLFIIGAAMLVTSSATFLFLYQPKTPKCLK